MSRQTITSAFAFIAPMMLWETRSDLTQYENNNNNNDDGDGDLFGGGGDLMDAANDTNEDLFVRSYFLPLTCSRAIFNVFTPLVAMNDDFEAIQEEQLDLYKLAPTLDFTLSLKLALQGTEDRKSEHKFAKLELNKIRFLRELKICGRVDKSDFTEIAKFGFLETLDLSGAKNVTNDDFSGLKGMTNLQKLIIQNFTRVTDVGFAHLPEICPNIQGLFFLSNSLSSRPTHSSRALQSLATCPSTQKSLKSLTYGGWRSGSNVAARDRALTDDTLIEDISKFTNLRHLSLRHVGYFSFKGIRSIALQLPHLVSLHIDAWASPSFQKQEMRVLCRYMGERLEVFNFASHGDHPIKFHLYWIAHKMVALRQLRYHCIYLENQLIRSYMLPGENDDRIRAIMDERAFFDDDEELKDKLAAYKGPGVPVRDRDGFWSGSELQRLLDDIRLKNIKLGNRIAEDYNSHRYSSGRNNDDCSTDCDSDFEEGE